MIVTLERTSTTAFDLESLMELWVALLPEHSDQPRVACAVGQNPVVIPIEAQRIVTSRCGLFSRKSGGELVIIGIFRQEYVLLRFDTLSLEFHWNEF